MRPNIIAFIIQSTENSREKRIVVSSPLFFSYIEILRFASEGEELAKKTPDEFSSHRQDPDSSKPTNGTAIPSSVFQRYQDLEFLGEGGMARVYRAFDPSLGRHVALKLIRGDDPTLLHRLLQEARSQGRIEHPNVCRVYEVGEMEGKACIAMQLIHGQTLQQISPNLVLEQKIRIMKEIAEAMHAAHKVGVIHRDLKPSNIMVEESENGALVPYVMDFGLAREVEDAGTTVTGTIVGSPSYMSPEQAMGEVHFLDRRTDVYSLGVTMYELFSGDLPFQAASTIDTLLCIIQDEPPPLRQTSSHIPRDLETIVMKCLEKEPENRYESALALSHDLHLFLEGLPITARPAGWFRRTYKRALRHKAITAVSAVALVLVLSFAAFGLFQYWKAQERAVLSQEFGQQVKEMEGFSRIALMLPLHNLQEERSVIQKRMEDIRGRMNQSGRISEGPGYYALGRGYLALQDYDRARESLQKALLSDYHSPELFYALGLSTGKLYERALADARRIGDRQVREAKIKKAQEEFRNPAVEYLSKSQGLEIESSEYVKGLIAFYEKKYPVALKKAREASEKNPWLYEAQKLEGDIHLQMGSEQYLHGNHDESLNEYKRAGEAYRAASENARSNPSIYRASCECWRNILVLNGIKRDSIKEPYQNGITACKKALQALPEFPEAFQWMSLLERAFADFSSRLHGEDPTEHIQKSIEYARKAIQLRPQNATNYWSAGAAFVELAIHELSTGLPPQNSLQEGIPLLEKAAELDQGNFLIFNTMGTAYSVLGEYEMGMGKDPRKSFDLAVAKSRQALSIQPEYDNAYGNIGYTYGLKSEYEYAHGIAPWDSLDQAMQIHKKSIELNPRSSDSFNSLGVTYAIKGEYELASGRNPMQSLKLAVKNYREAISRDSSFAYPVNNIGEADTFLAIYAISQDQDPTVFLEEAIRSHTKAIEMDPQYANAYARLAFAWKTQGFFDLMKGKDPSVSVQNARKAVTKALNYNDSNEFYYLVAADIDLLESRQKAVNGRSPTWDLDAALKALGRGLELAPDDVSLLQKKGEVLAWKATWFIKSGRTMEVDSVLDEGLKSVRSGLGIFSQHGELKATEGLLLLCRSRTERDPKLRRELAEQAAEVLRDGLRLNGNLKYRFQTFLNDAEKLIQ